MDYFRGLTELFRKIEIHTIEGKAISFDKAILGAVNLIKTHINKQNKIIIIGNGGSASIASHISTDFLKNAKIAALAFNDSSLITCLSNDLGYKYVFEKPIEMLAQKGDILFAISSSGKSKSILNAVIRARKKDCFIISLSGFSRKNPLRELGDINFYVPSNLYGYVEIIHLAICHCIVDEMIKKQK